MSIFRTVNLLANAVNDIREIRATDPKAAAEILVILEQINADPNVIDKLTTYGDNIFGTYRLSVRRWQKLKSVGSLWRFRMLDTPATSYRVIYGYHWQTRQLCILAVVKKETYDYDNLDTDINKRIISDWNAL